MPIPLGILAVAGAGAAASGAYELISTTSGSGTDTVTFSSIPATYRHLQVRWVAVLGSNPNSGLFLRLNGVSSGYTAHRLYGNGSSVLSTNNTSSSSIQLLGETGFLGTHPTTGIIDILDYANTNKNKTVRALSGCFLSGSSEISLNSGLFASTSAVTSLTIFAGGGSFTAANRISLYGIRG